VRQDELEADQERSRERRELQRRFALREERERDRRDDQEAFEDQLDDMQVRNARARGTGAQSQSENGESRLYCQPMVRSQNTLAAWSGFGSSRSTQKLSSVATTKPTAKSTLGRCGRRTSG
jgi:hypothetical protein